MVPHFGKVYKLAVWTKMLLLVHGTDKNLVWSCTPGKVDNNNNH